MALTTPNQEQRQEEFSRGPGFTRSWFAAITLGLVVAALGVAYTFLLVGAAVTSAVVLVLGGLIYALIAVPTITTRWITVPRRVQHTDSDELPVTRIHSFSTAAQRITFVLNVLLLFNLVFTIAAVATDPDADLEFAGILIVQTCAVALIIANGFWAYGRRYIVGEHEAMTRRIGRFRLIAANRVLSYVVWISYALVAGYLVISTVTSDGFAIRLAG